MITKIICGKFDNRIDFKIINNERVRIGSIHPNKIKYRNLLPIATQENVILFDNKKFNSRDFLNQLRLNKSDKLIVLTIKEKELILEELLDFNIDIYVFEVIYPIFNHIKYISNIHKNYNELIRLLNFTKDLGIYGKSLSKILSTEYLYKIERKLRYKNRFDKFFGFAYKGGYQEVFKLKEERENRIVVSFDFNSMFIDSMMGDFVEPKNIKYKNYNNEYIKIDNLSQGLYRVILKNPIDSFFNKFHPFKYTKLFQSFIFKLENSHQIEILLFKNEIEYYKQFFDEIEIIEGFFSKKVINHPLKDFAKEIYKKRLEYKEMNNEILSNLMKLKLITIHSSSNPRKYKQSFFKTKNEVLNCLKDEYMIDLTSEENKKDIPFVKNSKHIQIDKQKNKFKLKTINFDSNESIYCLSSQIIANSRLKMIQTIEKFLMHNSVEICYCNIDSIHISILETELNNFLEKFKYMISSKIGDLKIEAVAKKGYWFDIGRYWLIKDKKVILFKNRIFNNTTTFNKFCKTRRLKLVYKYKSFVYIKNVYKNLFNSFSYKKRVLFTNLDNYNFDRYNFSEIKNLNVVNETINNEVLKTKKVKIDLFKSINSTV